MRASVFNVIGFQIGWFACVLGAAHGLPWLGIFVAVPIIVWHLFNASDVRLELKLILIATMLGSLFDQALLSANLVQFPQSNWPAQILPVWMMTLWLLFCTTLNVSLRWMRSQVAVAVLFGALGGPLAYLGGAKLGAMQLHNVPQLMIILPIGWGIMMLVMLWLSARLDGFAGNTKARLSNV